MSGHPARPSDVAALHVYDQTGSPGVHVGLPSTSITWVLPVGDPVVVGWAGRPRERSVTSWTQVGGLHLGPAEIHHGSRQRGVYLELTVAGARSILGIPAALVAGELVDLGDLDGASRHTPELRHLPEQLAATPRDGWAALVRAALCAARERVARERRPQTAGVVAHALSRLARGDRVGDVAEAVGFSRRHLGDLVRSETGVSPTDWRRLARVERSHERVIDALRGRGTLARAASDAGYADQAHLTREWVALCGSSPTAWGRRELPSVQDGASPEAAG